MIAAILHSVMAAATDVMFAKVPIVLTALCALDVTFAIGTAHLQQDAQEPMQAKPVTQQTAHANQQELEEIALHH